MEIEKIREEVRKIATGLGKREVLAVGIFGSLARLTFDEKSDIDIFIITDKEIPLKEQDELYYAFSQLIPQFRRDVTVLVYDLDSLKKIPSWQTLNLVKDACFVFDQGEIEKLFDMILRKAKEQGIEYDQEEKVFKLKKPERKIFFLTE